MKYLSILQHCPHDLPALLQVFFLWDNRDSLRSQNGADAYVLQEVCGTSSEDLAEFVEVHKRAVFYLLCKILQVVAKLFRSEEF